ncbi:MAG: MFS transporter, partial [Muribaculaceae bacterium]|nr:MFS transporter [Muribaculaceae bacterium]
MTEQTKTGQIKEYLNDKKWARWTALALLAIAMFFGYVFVDILSPLQSYVQTEKGWDPQTWGNFFGSETFLNVFVFFLIFAGIILDKMGVRFTAILSGTVMVVGGLINWYAMTDAFSQSSLAQWFDGILNIH